MSLKIENVQINAAAFAVATILEDLYAAARHKIPADKPKARVLLAAYIRDKRAELDKAVAPLNLIDAKLASRLVLSAAETIVNERAEIYRAIRERKARYEAERAATAAMLTPVAA